MTWRAWVGACVLSIGLGACAGDGGDVGGDQLACGDGDTVCGRSCVDTAADPRHCGGCDVACDAGAACSDGVCEPDCPAGFENCDGTCRDLSTSRTDCGGCGVACATGEVCVDAACVTTCPGDQQLCDGACHTLDNSAENCGSCGNVCEANEVCAGGVCETGCGPGQIACEGGCHDAATSRLHCGACGNTCALGEQCVDAACVPDCAGGLTACDGMCSDLTSDRSNCGQCGTACGAGEVCSEGACERVCAGGTTDCGDTCHDLGSDRANCGACGNACADGEICSAGTCALACTGFAATECDGRCTNTEVDPLHCGGCGNACQAGEVCNAGSCASECAETADVCGGSCTSLGDDPANCGACGTTCATAANAVPACTAAGCVGACLEGYADCNADLQTPGSDGCERMLATDFDNCGACGVTCPTPDNAGSACTNGVCAITACAAGFLDCDTDLANGCEVETTADPTNCGGCGIECSAAQLCSNGVCTTAVAEDCSSAVPLVGGPNSIAWIATENDYLAENPSCLTPAMSGPDLVLRYDATFDGAIDLTIGKAASSRMAAVVSSASCGTVTDELGCVTDYAPTTMSGSFRVRAGTPYFIYLIDSTQGAAVLADPLQVTVTEYDCSTYPAAAVTASSPQGSISTLTPRLEVTFDGPIDPSAGPITFTGNLGTNRSHSLTSGAISWSADRRTMTIDAQLPFAPNEVVTVGWTGLLDERCSKPVAPPPAWTVSAPSLSCPATTVGLQAPTMTRHHAGIVGTISENYVAVDGDPNGYVYVGGTSTLFRRPKAGGTTVAVHTAAGLSGNHLGYGMLIDGADLYTLATKTTATEGHLFRISRDGGATWHIQDMATFPTAPGDDFRGVAKHAGRIYLITHENTASATTEIWSIDASASTLPAVAVLEGSFSGHYHCAGLAVDAANFYTSCRLSGTSYAILRIDRTSGVKTSIASGLTGNTFAMALHAVDHGGDGIADVLYRSDDRMEGYLVCDPAGTPVGTRHFGFGTATTNYGLALDPVANALWAFDDDTLEFIEFR